MKKNFTNNLRNAFLLTTLLLFLSTLSFGQLLAPQFFNFNAGNSSNPVPLNNSSNFSQKAQFIYAPGVFNSNGTLGGTPAFLGLITSVYFRAGNSVNTDFTDFSISLSQNVGTQTQWSSTTFNLGMTQVVQANPKNITVSSTNWFEVQLQNPFIYDPSLSLAVELKQNGFSPFGLNIRTHFVNTPNARIYGGYNSNIANVIGSGRADFGFDLMTPTPCDSLSMMTGTLQPSNPTVCSGQVISFSAPNSSLGGNMTYQWQRSTNGITWNNIAGANTLTYTTPPQITSAQYRLIINCTVNNVSDTSAPSIVTVAPPTHAALPYIQDFENWVSYCDNSEVPDDYHWLNGSPSTGNNSWRREDEGATAVWNMPAGGLYFPSSTTGNHSARFHSFSTNSQGVLDLHVDCSNTTGTKTLSFDYINNNTSAGNDNLQIEVFNGMFFLPVASYGSSGAWQSQFVAINSNAPNTIIRFTASGGSINNVPGSDIGIDNVMVLEPCTAAPVAGIIDSTTACPNKPLLLSLSGNSQQGGITYSWDTASTANGPWGTFAGSPGPTLTATGITQAFYWRARVNCTASGISDTTAARYVDVLPFYICYCDNEASVLQFENIGNVNLRDKIGSPPLINNGIISTVLNNSTAINPYSLFQFTPAPILYKDTNYYLDLSGISYVNNFNNCWAKGYIDFNRDGVYNVTSELVMNGPVGINNNYVLMDSFQVPSNIDLGLTGMRIILQEGGGSLSVTPCGIFGRGEVEDYVVNLQFLPCNSPPNAGISLIDDTAVCVNNVVRIANNTHDRFFANIDFSWQESSNGTTFFDIPNGDVDTMFRTITQDTWFRYRTTCQGTSNAFSNVVKVRVLPPANCLTPSPVTGPDDKSDIGAIVIGDPPPTNTQLYTFSSGGAHLSNPASYRTYTNHTAKGFIDLALGRTYKMSIFHILNTAIHNDAQVSIFIDYDGNQVFDVMNGERVYNSTSTAANFFLNAIFTIPTSAVTGTPLFMRFVINDDLGPNPANDVGFGTITSGEVEDFYVRFTDPVGTKDVYGTIDNVAIYPNPTSDDLNVTFSTKESTEVTIDLLTLTGSVLLTEKLANVSGKQSTTLNVKDFASGVYMLRFSAGDSKFVRRVTITK